MLNKELIKEFIENGVSCLKDDDTVDTCYYMNIDYEYTLVIKYMDGFKDDEYTRKYYVQNIKYKDCCLVVGIYVRGSDYMQDNLLIPSDVVDDELFETEFIVEKLDIDDDVDTLYTTYEMLHNDYELVDRKNGLIKEL